MNTFNKPVLSAVLSNLAKAAEKQQNFQEAENLNLLSGEYWLPVSGDQDLSTIRTLIGDDLEDGYQAVITAADSADDDGARRCIKWGEKVTAIQKSLVNRYESKGEDLFDDKKLYICEACGFIALGNDTPEICPVCKAPSSRFSKVRSAS